jgi:hypothetical protein
MYQIQVNHDNSGWVSYSRPYLTKAGAESAIQAMQDMDAVLGTNVWRYRIVEV